jgi:hypothetical protein
LERGRVARRKHRFSVGVVVLALFVAFSFGAIARYATADNYHVTCVGHGFVSGSSQSDGSFFARVEHGCSSTSRTCAVYTYGSFQGSQSQYDLWSDCSAWSRDFNPSLIECASAAHLSDPVAFSDHAHAAPGWCG